MTPVPTPDVVSINLAASAPQGIAWLGWLAAQLVYYGTQVFPTLFGSVVSIIAGRDYSWWRVTAGILCGQFMGMYFTDIFLHYLPLEQILSHDQAHQAVAAALGATGLAIVTQSLAAVQNGQIPIIGPLLRMFTKGEPLV